MSYKFLVTGDIHLGRRTVHPSSEIDDSDLSVSRSWQRLIETAIDHQVEALLITGDLIDKENAWFEALHSLKAGLQQLDQNNIKVYAVAGNHDALVLPQLDDVLNEVSGFSLLGKGRSWEQVTHQCIDGRSIEIAGWSFDKEHVHANPVSSGVPEPESSLSITLLHTDLNGPPDSGYAPVSETDLANSGRPVWLLGHIHKPNRVQHQNPLILYPGSPHALHANETGVHGPWMMQIEVNGRVHAEQIPLSPVRYEQVEISLDQLTEEWKSEFQSRIITRLNDDLDRSVRWYVIDVICTGDPSYFDTIQHYFNEESEREIERSPSIYIRKVVNRTGLPPANLEKLAERGNLEGILAKLLIQLDQPDKRESLQELLQKAEQTRQKVLRHDVFKPVYAEDPGDEASEDVTGEEAEALLKHAANEWLTELRKQNDEMQQ